MSFPEVDWPRLWLEALGSMLSAVTGLVVGAWRWGRHSARREERALEQAARIKEMEEKYTDITDQFKESFAGIRRQIDNEILVRERDFLRKDDFKEWVREEYRADMRDVKQALHKLNGK